MDHNYAKHKLALLLRDIDNYNDGEFFREMSRIVDGATDRDGWEALAAQNLKLKAALIDFAETVDMLDDHTHPNIECDAVACSMREIADSKPAAILAEIKAQAVEEFAVAMEGFSPEYCWLGLEDLPREQTRNYIELIRKGAEGEK